jgi:predicted tellurium resistance membrane protein TerC
VLVQEREVTDWVFFCVRIFLQQAVAAVLGFIGSKMVLDFFGFHVPTELSLAVVITLL